MASSYILTFICPLRNDKLLDKMIDNIDSIGH